MSSLIQSQRIDPKESMVNDEEKKQAEMSQEERDRKESAQSNGTLSEL